METENDDAGVVEKVIDDDEVAAMESGDDAEAARGSGRTDELSHSSQSCQYRSHVCRLGWESGDDQEPKPEAEPRDRRQGWANDDGKKSRSWPPTS